MSTTSVSKLQSKQNDCDSCLALRAAFDSGDVETGSDATHCDGLEIGCA